MTSSVITFFPYTPIFEAIRTLLSKQISGAPVVDEDGRVVGVLSELDCLRMLSSDEFYAGQQEEAGVAQNFMTAVGKTIPPTLGIYAIAHYFLTKGIRRLPVVDGEQLVGQVSRRDVLGLIDRMSRRRTDRKHYPDYREPEKHGSSALPRGVPRCQEIRCMRGRQ